MNYSEMRTFLRQLYAQALSAKKERILATGRLSSDERARWADMSAWAGQAVDDGDPFAQLGPERLEDIIAKHDLPIPLDSTEFATFGVEHQRAIRELADAVLGFDASLERLDLNVAASTPSIGGQPAPASTLRLSGLIERYKLERERDPVGERSAREWDDHFALLHEILGSDLNVHELNESHAQQVKSTLLIYPKNRRKNPATRELSLQDAVAATGVDKIATPTINKYLQTYISLFTFAKRHHYVATNFFDGTFIARRKGSKKSLRDPFSAEQLRRIVTEAAFQREGLVRHDWQKWGILIAAYSGARLNEIAQLQVADVRNIEGVLCFDVTDVGDDDDGETIAKQLKTEAAKRVVPVHPELIALGLMDYVEGLRRAGTSRLFPTFKQDVNNGWGRQLGRWANDTFLVKLGYKTKRVVFHSFRHTLITRLSQSGVQEPIVKALVGHEQQGVTQTSYLGEGYKPSQLYDAICLMEPKGLSDYPAVADTDAAG
jgi:integrase